METAAGGGPRWPASTSRASATSRSTCIAPSRAGSRRSASSAKAAAGTWCCPAMTSRPRRCPRPAGRSAWTWASPVRDHQRRRAHRQPRFARESAGSWPRLSRRSPARSAGRPTAARPGEVAEVHRRIRNRRADLHHKAARALVHACDVIALEDLAVKNMTRSASRTLELPGTNVAAKSGLNRSILDAGWAQFTSILAAKAEEAGRVWSREPRLHSIDCHPCGARGTAPAGHRVCPVHAAMDDVNAALNILRGPDWPRPAHAA